MKTKVNTLVMVTALLILAGCDKSRTIQIKAGKTGGIYEINPAGMEYKHLNGIDTFMLDTATCISFYYFKKNVQVESDGEEFNTLSFTLDQAGKSKLRDLSARNMGKSICFVLGDKVIMAPTVQGPISNGEFNIMLGDKKELDEMVEYLEK